MSNGYADSAQMRIYPFGPKFGLMEWLNTIPTPPPKSRGERIADTLDVSLNTSEVKRQIATIIDSACAEAVAEATAEPSRDPCEAAIVLLGDKDTNYPAGTTSYAKEFASTLVREVETFDDGWSFLKIDGYMVGGEQTEEECVEESHAIRRALAAAFDEATDGTEEEALKERVKELEAKLANSDRLKDWYLNQSNSCLAARDKAYRDLDESRATYANLHNNTNARIAAAVKAEREACAKTAAYDGMTLDGYSYGYSDGRNGAANLIRLRG